MDAQDTQKLPDDTETTLLTPRLRRTALLTAIVAVPDHFQPDVALGICLLFCPLAFASPAAGSGRQP
jgi:hypothetical protein